VLGLIVKGGGDVALTATGVTSAQIIKSATAGFTRTRLAAAPNDKKAHVKMPVSRFMATPTSTSKKDARFAEFLAIPLYKATRPVSGHT
jgi:hypothetical protein